VAFIAKTVLARLFVCLFPLSQIVCWYQFCRRCDITTFSQECESFENLINQAFPVMKLDIFACL
jgi:hypothetical protein